MPVDYLIFSFGVLGSMAILHRWLRKRGKLDRLPIHMWGGVLLLLALGWIYADAEGRRAYDRIRTMVEGFPPTYAQELQRMGHSRIATDTPADDGNYARMIDAQIRWTKANPSIADIYTMRKLADGRIALIVDSETDYDRSGKFEGEREQRTAIGEIFEKSIPALNKAFTGEPAFMDEPYTDRWGEWVSAFVPMFDGDGRVEAVCGVDYPADRWNNAIRVARLHALAVILLIAVVAGGAQSIITLFQSDLRERKANEKRIEQLNVELEARVAARTAELEAAHGRLLEASHRAGMAEVATSVLHNVGNVLNSLNVSATVLSTQVNDLKVEPIGRVIDLLRTQGAAVGSFFDSDPKGRLVLPFLDQVLVYLTEKQAHMRKEATVLRFNVEHVRAVVQMQQGFAKVRGVVEKIAIRVLVDECITLSSDLIQKHDVQVVKEFKIDPVIALEKHKAMQILVNLIRNACDACSHSPGAPRTVAITIEAENDMLEINVSDNGIGISADVLPRLFAHGFTTRNDGHGFGLHSAAVAAKELRGSLKVTSPGLGHGASFSLRLPLGQSEPDLPGSQPVSAVADNSAHPRLMLA